MSSPVSTWLGDRDRKRTITHAWFLCESTETSDIDQWMYDPMTFVKWRWWPWPSPQEFQKIECFMFLGWLEYRSEWRGTTSTPEQLNKHKILKNDTIVTWIKFLPRALPSKGWVLLDQLSNIYTVFVVSEFVSMHTTNGDLRQIHAKISQKCRDTRKSTKKLNQLNVDEQ